VSSDGSNFGEKTLSTSGVFFTTGPVVPVDAWVELSDLTTDLFALITQVGLYVSNTVADPPNEFDFGDMASGLANGFRLWYEDDDTARFYLSDTIKTNIDAQLFMGDMQLSRFAASEMIMRFEKDFLGFSKGFLGSAQANGKFGVTIEEDSAGTPGPGVFYIKVEGLTLNNPDRFKL
jgi:hypothetical protein